MPVKSLEKPGFEYVAYRRESPKDYMDFKTELFRYAKDKKDSRDIVVDATKADVLNEAEIELLLRVLRELRGTKRTLRLIMSKPIFRKLESSNLFHAPNVAGYDNHKDFMADIRNLKASATTLKV